MTGGFRLSKKCFFLSPHGLGDIVHQTPVARFFHDQGYETFVTTPKHYAPAFESIEFMNVVPIPFLYFPHKFNQDAVSEVVFTERGEKYLSSMGLHEKDSILVSNGILDIPGEYHGTIIDPHHRYSDFKGAPIHRCGRSANSLGLPIDNFEMAVGFNQTEQIEIVHEGTKPPIGIAIGSREFLRAVPPEVMFEVIKELQKDFSVHVFGVILQDNEEMYIDKVIEAGAYPIIRPSNQNPASLRNLLNWMSKMKLFIGTDSGLLHCAIAMKIKSLYLESCYIIEQLIPQEHLSHVKTYGEFELSCKKNCMGKLLRKHSKEKPNIDRTTIFDANHDSLYCRPYSLSCFDDGKTYPECMSTLNPVKIKEAAKQMLGL